MNEPGGLDKAKELMRNAWAKRREAFDDPKQTALMQEAGQMLVDAVNICRELDAQPDLAQAIHLLANVENDLEHSDAAKALWEEAVAICRAVGDPLQLAHKIRHLGDLHRHLGDLDEAEACLTEAITLYRNEDDPPKLDFANAITRQAALLETLARPNEALKLWQEAQDLYGRVGLDDGVEMCSVRVKQLGSL